MKILARLSQQLSLRSEQVGATVSLLDEDNTIPFIARYRKEATGGLDEEQIRNIRDWLERLRSLEERRKTILNSIEEQGMLTPELEQRIVHAETRTELEDIYQPYKPKRKTRASVAREKGLQGLADMIMQQEPSNRSLSDLAKPFRTESVPDMEGALAGARDIVAEAISDHTDIRQQTRDKALKWGLVITEKIEDAEDPKGIYELYYNFSSRVDRLQPHQVLAINRGENQNVLRVKVAVAERDWRTAIKSFFRPDRKSPLAEQLELAIDDAAERLLLPAIERDVRRSLTDQSEEHAIRVFATNLRALLNQPPLSEHNVLGIDPGFRTGCKIAVTDQTGKVLDTSTIYPHDPQRRWDEAIEYLDSLVSRYDVSLIAIGNGTASRETEQLVAQLTRRDDRIHYLIVSEAGASVYSASRLAREELPDLDVSLRGAVSIARRVQDPLAELVKIDPKSIGIGMYQHDVDQKKLSETLNGVVESVVNRVGVDLNTASAALLAHVAGIGPRLAERIVAHRDEKGPFSNRHELLVVSGLGPKAFEQAAGFLRIRGGGNSLDASAIHPESYAVAESVIARAKVDFKTPPDRRREYLQDLLVDKPVQQLAAELGTGVPTLEDILEQLVRPGRDPREELPAPILRSDVLSMDDLKLGMRLMGTVRNVVDFGAFIDVGVKNDGLLHRSQIPRGQNLKVGDIVEVEIQKVEPERGRISLGWTETQP
ncbi:MAG TPA: Tex family protein [Anaerolineales bacterium]